MNFALRSPTFTFTPTRFVWLFVLFNTLVFHLPLLQYLSSHLEIGSRLGLGVLLVVLCVSCALMWLLLGSVALISVHGLKPIASFMLLGNALALYAMNSYGVVLDKTMMGNVWNTDRQEALGLFHPSVLLYAGVALLLVALLWRGVRWKPQPRWVRAGHGLLALALCAGVVFSQSSAWLWVDQHAKMIGGLLLPWSYSANSLRYWAEQREARRPLLLLPDVSWNPAPTNAPAPVTVVLVIGESARAANFSLYGYARNTNPLLQKLPLWVLPKVQACATYTRRALECLLSHEPDAKNLRHETLADYLARSGQVDVLWRSRNWGEPRMQHVKPVRSAELSAQCRAHGCEPDLDESLLVDLEAALRQPRHERQLIVLHQAGSHGPAYHQKYPPASAAFEPACASVDLKQCTAQSLSNAYDNTIVYTDQLLARLIGLLSAQTQRRTVLLYLSDHGESLGEGGWYLHGAPDLVAPREQLDIPFLLWLSPNHAPLLKPGAGPKREPLIAPEGTHPYGQWHVFHTVLGALGARSTVYRSDYDVLTPWRQSNP